jgi:anti-sigma B factor antagonist
MSISPAGFSARVQRCPPQCLLILAGELDIDSSTALTALTGHVLSEARNATEALVLDMAQVSFIDAAGVTALLTIHDDAAAAGVELRLRALPRPVRRILRLLELEDAFIIEDPDTDPGQH